MSQELGDQPRLAGAGIARQAHDLRAAFPHALECREQTAEFLVAPDQRAGEAQGREPTRRLRLGERAQQAMHDHRLGFAAQDNGAGGLEGEAMAGERLGRCRDHDGARRRLAQQA